MFFVGCPCSCCVANSQRYCGVEKSWTMIEHVVFRCQLLSVLAECRPCSSDSILDFRRFLVVERDFLTKIFHAFISGQYFDFHVFHFKFLFCVRVDGARVAENFRLIWMNPKSTFSVLFLNSHNIFRSCSLDVANSSTSSANLRFVRQSWSWSLRHIPIPFLLCRRWISSFSEYWRNVSNSKPDNGSPCLVPFRILTMLLSSSVCTDAFWSLYIFFRRLM